jgi:hypothetical protein
MARPRAADDFAAIRARMLDLRRERQQATRGDTAERTPGKPSYSVSRVPGQPGEPEPKLFRDRGRFTR